MLNIVLNSFVLKSMERNANKLTEMKGGYNQAAWGRVRSGS